MHFVIAGRTNCPQYTYAVMVAQRLKENLPDFTFTKMTKKPEDWNRWLINICKENEWYHIHSPLIWREIGLTKGKKDFVGSINKFLDLCYDYYGIPREVLSAESFNRGEMNWFKNRTEYEYFEAVKDKAKKRREYRSRQVCITAASSPEAEIIIMELLKIPIQKREDGLEIRLYDEPTKEKKIQSSAIDAKYCPGPSGFGNCRVVTTLKDALTNIDLVIVLDSFLRKPSESLVKWLKRNRNAMCVLGKALNIYAPKHCRVIIGSPSSQPICYNATVLASFATKLHVRNIVAVTHDLGREMLKALSTRTQIPVQNFYCPPVWGFIGLNKFVDLNKTLQTFLYKVPGKRLNSTLPQGTEEYELRTSEGSLTKEDITKTHEWVFNHKAEAYPQLGRWPCLAKATAIIDLLKIWGLQQEDGNGEIMCLGVYSDGTFNIPQGIYWSQPVILTKGFWVPFADFPIPRSVHVNCHYLFLYGIAALYRTKIKPRIYISPKPTGNLKEPKKFDIEKILENPDMPVIRTDAECLKFLKSIARKELGLDFDVVDNNLYEEPEPKQIKRAYTMEEATREEMYCECWRQELKQLQKVVFDRSSTTEVEVDLSENLSGSDWSVINPQSGSCGPTKNISERSRATSEVLPSGSAGSTGRKKAESKSSSSTSVVCSCGILSTGSICRCLAQKEEETGEGEVSTEHFYKDQNAHIFDEDLKDAIYADSYVRDKHVTFDPTYVDNKQEKPPFKFYGKKDAIRDVKADKKMRQRILRYERGGEESVEEEEEPMEGEKESDITDEKVKDPKFHISIDGVSYDIIGNQEGLENLDEMRKSASDRKSLTTFREIYSDEIVPTLQVLPPDVEKSTSSSYSKSASIYDEDHLGIEDIYKDFSEPYEKRITEEPSKLSIEGEDWSEGLFHVESDKLPVDELKELKESKHSIVGKRKIEGIPLCAQCQCIVPTGLTYCPCGASTVVEVVKQESVEIIIQTEDDLTYRVEYFETLITPETSSLSSGMLPEIDATDDLPKKALPPESFFPFSPKLENKFKETPRPEEMTKEYLDSVTQYAGKSLPDECIEMIKLVKKKMKNRKLKRRKQEEEGEFEAEEDDDDDDDDAADDDDEEEEEGEGEMDDEIDGKKIKFLFDASSGVPCQGDDSGIKTNFSDMKMFLPCGLEDWRMTVQKKHREWFFQGPRVRDECYYSFAIEEISDDEYEVDKELEKYFEN